LLQNGADLPIVAAPIPLSPSARQYLDFKADQKTGKRTVPVVPGGQPNPSGDVLPALPHITAGNGSTPSERARDRDARLQKRVSASGRLVKNTFQDFAEGKRGS
jgi:Arf-GAP/SH3 domain/ANK repeat/PH domain-containing protein